MKEEQLIFIVSQPRSGSTYLQNLLSNNDEVNTCSEPWILLNFASQIKPGLVSGTFDNKLAVSAFTDYLNKYQELTYNEVLKDFLLNLYEPVSKGFRYVIDKTPRYWEILDELIEWFPNSKVIILKRDPCNVATSIIKTWNIDSLEKLNYYHRDLLLAPKTIHAFCEANKENKNVHSLRYEDLINNTSDEVKSLYQWIGISYTENVLDTSKNNKFRGKYGDPFQNSSEDANEIRKAVSELKLDAIFESFLKGYKNYLGDEFLNNYGNYTSGQTENTGVFEDFKILNASTDELKISIANLKRQLKNINRSKDYKLGKNLLFPFRFIKRLIQ